MILFGLSMLGPSGLSGESGPPQPSPSHRVLVVGDSLAVGTAPFLGDMLAGYELRWEIRSGRTTPEGLRRLRESVPAFRPQTVVVSLGTNDGSDPRRFAERIARVRAAVPARACVVWASLFRPPRKGAFTRLNRVLDRVRERDERLTVVQWDDAVRQGAVRLADGLHPDEAGYRYRSALFADAVKRGCRARD